MAQADCSGKLGGFISMQVQLLVSDDAAEVAPGSVTNSNDNAHRGESGSGYSRTFSPDMQIRVQVQDPTGGTWSEGVPDSSGRLRLQVCKNMIYVLRVTGREIEEAKTDDLQPRLGDRLVTVTLHKKLTREQRAALEKQHGGSVSAHGLKIPGKARKQLRKGDAAVAKEKLPQAEKFYRKAIDIYPEYEEAENSLGVVLMREGRKSEGKAAFERALGLNEHFANAAVNLAKLAVEEKRYKDAHELGKQALRNEPLNPGALFVAAEGAFFTGAFSETVEYARTLHSLPHQPYGLVHFLAGRSLEAEEQPQAAMAEYRLFLDEDPSDPNANRAREYLTLLEVSRNSAESKSH